MSSHYGNSPYKLFCNVYPNHNWLPWRFGVTTRSFWQDENNKKEYIKWLGNQLNIKDYNGWYNVTQHVCIISLYFISFYIFFHLLTLNDRIS